MTTKSRKTSGMTKEHKAALAHGRKEGLVVRRYLEALEANKPRRGRKRTPASIQKRLDLIACDLAYVDGLTHLKYLQEQSDLQAELAQLDDSGDIAPLEKGFVKVAKLYSERKGISYSTWRQSGVSADVLHRAGIAQTRG